MQPGPPALNPETPKAVAGCPADVTPEAVTYKEDLGPGRRQGVQRSIKELPGGLDAPPIRRKDRRRKELKYASAGEFVQPGPLARQDVRYHAKAVCRGQALEPQRIGVWYTPEFVLSDDPFEKVQLRLG